MLLATASVCKITEQWLLYSIAIMCYLLLSLLGLYNIEYHTFCILLMWL